MKKLALLAGMLFLIAFDAAAQTADLTIVPWKSEDSYYRFTAYNGGPGVAEDVVLTIDIPAALQVEEIEDDEGRCDATARPVRCVAPTLRTVGDALQFAFRATGPAVDATYTITARVESRATDPNLQNNMATLTFTTRMADLHSTVEPSAVRIDPGAAQVFRTSISNWRRDSYPADIVVRYTATNATIEAIVPDDPRWTCSFSGATGECRTTSGLEPGCRCSSPINVTLRSNADRSGGQAKLEVVSTSGLYQEPYPGNATVETYRVFAVTNTDDAGPGSLREALTRANESCTPGPCKVAFEIAGAPSSDGWFTIVPQSDRPLVTAARVAIDGTWQTRYIGDTNVGGPEVAIDGRFMRQGLDVRSACDAVVEGLAIGGVREGYGLFFAPGNCSEPLDRKLVRKNHLGIDPVRRPWPNLRGLYVAGKSVVEQNVISRNTLSGIWVWEGSARIMRNQISANGRSGVLLGPDTTGADVSSNEIRDHGQMGVAVLPGAELFTILRNWMIDNGGLGIDIGLDGSSPVDDDDDDLLPSNAPVLHSAVYEASSGTTLVTMSLRSRRLGPYIAYFDFDFYVNRGPDGDGEQWIGGESYHYGDNDGTPFTIRLYGNYVGKWINATSTRAHTAFSRPPGRGSATAETYSGEGRSTSELSNTVLVAP
ncbi:MAG TPA: right-handed parallel beta-helix repeat-containing protein [Thermoanaerobaculia bacterium]